MNPMSDHAPRAVRPKPRAAGCGPLRLPTYSALRADAAAVVGGGAVTGVIRVREVRA